MTAQEVDAARIEVTAAQMLAESGSGAPSNPAIADLQAEGAAPLDEATAQFIARLRAEGAASGLTHANALVDEVAAEAERVRSVLWAEHDAQLRLLKQTTTVDREAYKLRTRREARRIVEAEERPPVEWPETLTLREQLALPVVPVVWRVEGWLPAGGRTVLAAQAKAGKTTLSVNLVRSLVDGVPWLGQDRVTPLAGKVAVLDFEMTERQLREWYRRAGIVNDDQVLLLALRGRASLFDLRDEEIRAQWAELLVAHGVAYVVWDCLRPALDALGLDENHDAGLLLTGFDALLSEAGGPEALVVHHMGHSGERARGDSRIVGWGDANWKLVLEDGDEAGPRWLTAYGRDVDRPETQLELDGVTGWLTAVGGSRAVARLTAATQAVVDVLSGAAGPLKAGDVEALVMGRGIAREAARKALQGLVSINQVTVEVGDRGARLHTIRPEFASSPESAETTAADYVASSPEPAETTAADSLASSPPAYRAASGDVLSEEEEQDQIADGEHGDPSDLSPELRELVQRLDASSGGRA